MFKLQSKEPNKNVWLVDPVMSIGSAKHNEIVLQGTGVLGVHAKIHTGAHQVHIESVSGAQTYINEQPINFKSDIKIGDIIRIGTHEYALINPSANPVNPFAKQTEKPMVSADATVFRGSDPKQKPAPVNNSSPHDASGWYLQAMHQSLKNKRYPIDETITLGRSKECGLAFSYDRLSRQHAEFQLFDGVLFVKDLDSSNGVFHNGQKVAQAKLSHGDSLAFEKLEFTVIGPGSANDQEKLEKSALNETVVRAAITPEMIKQAKGQGSKKTAGVGHAAKREQKEKNRLHSVAYIIVGLVVAAAIISATLVL